MNEQPKLQPDDAALLARIDAALAGLHDQNEQDDLTALAAYAASAASTLPRADAGFQGRLEAHLLAAWEHEIPETRYIAPTST